MTHSIHDQPLPYADQLPTRDASAIDVVVIHCTELPDLATAREYGEKAQHENGTGNCGHFYVDRDGAIVCYVPVTRVANHVRGHNPGSVGIELVNLGRYPHWWDSRHQIMTEPYTEAQLNALAWLLQHLRNTLPNLSTIAGHEDLDTASMPATDDPSKSVPRKLDPGPLFPWDRILGDCGLQRNTAAT
jgi:N-acetylmuramoyl-L-alanine amidase